MSTLVDIQLLRAQSSILRERSDAQSDQIQAMASQAQALGRENRSMRMEVDLFARAVEHLVKENTDLRSALEKSEAARAASDAKVEQLRSDVDDYRANAELMRIEIERLKTGRA